MSLLPMDDPDYRLSVELSVDILNYLHEEAVEGLRNPEPKRIRFTSGPSYGDGCYNISGNIDLRAMSDRIVKFIRAKA